MRQSSSLSLTVSQLNSLADNGCKIPKACQKLADRTVVQRKNWNGETKRKYAIVVVICITSADWQSSRLAIRIGFSTVRGVLCDCNETYNKHAIHHSERLCKSSRRTADVSIFITPVSAVVIAVTEVVDIDTATAIRTDATADPARTVACSRQTLANTHTQVIWAKLTWHATAALLPHGQSVCSVQ